MQGIDRRKEEPTKTHVNRSLSSTSLLNNIIGSPVEPIQDIRSCTGLALKHFHGQEFGLLCYTVSRTTNGASNVGSVPDGVDMLTLYSIVGKTGTATKLLVGNADTGIHHVAVGAFASAVVVDIGRAWGSSVGDTAQTPGSIVLGGNGIKVPGLVLFNVGDLFSIARTIWELSEIEHKHLHCRGLPRW